LFIGISAIASRSLYYKLSDFNDGDNDTFFTYNFDSYSNSAYSITILTFLLDNTMHVVSTLNKDWRIYILLWLFVAFAAKIIIQNFTMAILYYFYNKLYHTDVVFIKGHHPKIEKYIETQIITNRYSTTRLRQMIFNYLHSGKIDHDIVEIERFYKNAASNRYQNQHGANPDSVEQHYDDMLSKTPYVVLTVGLEALNILIVLIAAESSPESLYILYPILMASNFILTMDQIMYLLSNKFKTFNIIYALDVLATAIIYAFTLICVGSYKTGYINEIIEENNYFKKTIGLLVIAKSWRLYKSMLMIEKVKVVFEVVAKSRGFIFDILGMYAINMFFFATLGIAIFGGNVTSDTPVIFEKTFGSSISEGFLTVNFNDYFNSFVALFSISMNGWSNILIVNSIEEEHVTMGHAIFFVIYFLLARISFFSILFGFLVDNVCIYLGMSDEKKAQESKKNKKGSDDDDGNPKPQIKADDGAKSTISEDLDVYLKLKKPKESAIAKDLHIIKEENDEDEKNGNQDQNDELGDLHSQDDLIDPELSEELDHTISLDAPPELAFKPSKNRTPNKYDPVQTLFRA